MLLIEDRERERENQETLIIITGDIDKTTINL